MPLKEEKFNVGYMTTSRTAKVGVIKLTCTRTHNPTAREIAVLLLLVSGQDFGGLDAS